MIITNNNNAHTQNETPTNKQHETENNKTKY